MNHVRAEGRGQRAEGRGQRAEGTDADRAEGIGLMETGQRAEGLGLRAKGRGLRAAVCLISLLFIPQPLALSPFSVSARAEIIDRVLAILPGQILTLSDLEAALDLGLVEAPAGTDRVAGGLAALIDRILMLNEVRRVVPPEPTAAALDARVAGIRKRFGSPAELSRMLAARGVDETVLRIYAADDLRLASYLDERFSVASQPTDEEIRQAGEAARPKLVAERRQTLVSAWIADLRRRADVTVLP